MALGKNNKGKGGVFTAGLGLGIAAGVAAGALVIAPHLPGASSTPDTRADAGAETSGEPNRDADIASAQADSSDSLLADLAPGVVEGTLADRPVMILRTADAPEGPIDEVGALLADAGAIDAGSITLTDSFFSADAADELKSIAANTLPAGAQLTVDAVGSGTHAGELLAAALLMDPGTGEPYASSEDRALVLQSLRDAGFIEYEDGTILPAQGIVFAVSDDEDAFAVDNQTSFVEALDAGGAATVVTGPIESASDNALLGHLRAGESEVSTVDSVDRAWGRVAVVLAVAEQIAGENGDYGAAADVDATSPALPTD